MDTFRRRFSFAQRTIFVGRELERSKLCHLTEQAMRGRGSLALVSGEPGIGKTRLCEEVALEAEQRGAKALISRCREGDAAVPYLPFVEIVEAIYVHSPDPASIRAALGDDAAAVAKAVPQLRQWFDDIPPALDLPPEQERRLMFNGMRDFIGRLAAAHPLLLVVEDLHWADRGTLALLLHIAERIAEPPLAMVATYRDNEVAAESPLEAALEEVTRERAAIKLALRRFDGAGVKAMLQALSGQQPPEAVVELFVHETEGNPFFIEEMFEHLREEGKLLDSEGNFQRSLETADADVPHSLRVTIGRRLSRLSPQTREVLILAAVIGRDFSYQLLAALAPSREALEAALEEARRARIIVESSSSAKARFSFVHELFRQTLLSDILAPHLQRLHLQVGDAIHQVYPQALERFATELAHHYYQAGPLAEVRTAVKFMRMAGEKTLSVYEFEEAVRWLERALELKPTDSAESALICQKLGLAELALGRWEDALRHLNEMLDIYLALGDADRAARACWETLNTYTRGGPGLQGKQLADRALAAIGNRVTPERCRLQAMSGYLATMAGGRDAEPIRLAEALAVQLDDAKLSADIEWIWVHHHFAGWQIHDALAAGVRAAKLLRAQGQLWGLADVLSVLVGAYAESGNFGALTPLLEELEPLAHKLGHAMGDLYVIFLRDVMEFCQTGNLDQWIKIAPERIEVHRRSGVAFEAMCRVRVAFAEFWRGNWQNAPAELEKAVSGLVGDSFGFWAYAEMLKAHSARSAEAVERLLRHCDELPKPGASTAFYSQIILFCSVEAFAAAGEKSRAAALHPLVVQAIDNGMLLCPFSFRLIPTLAGIAASCGEDWETAEAHFQHAMQLAKSMPHRLEQAESRRFYSMMLIDRDAQQDRDKARELLTEAITI